MSKKNIEKWIEFLRGDHYYQGKYRLCTGHKGYDEFCCLGVACEAYIHSGGELDVVDRGCSVIYDGEGTTIPRKVRKWLDLPEYGISTRDLIKMNDIDEMTFEQIADYLEGMINRDGKA